MTYNMLDTVVLASDIPEHNLRAGDIGAVVEVYDDEAVEVEFVLGSGRTQALLTLPVGNVRPISPTDIPAVRSSDSASAA
ncbi:MAG: DUF4926 domain-containing protein [Halioglobus sp.]|nr:DUF4926 domain-containing protein [Halioglobus sp.]